MSFTGEEVGGLPLNSCLSTSTERSQNTDKARHGGSPVFPLTECSPEPPRGLLGKRPDKQQLLPTAQACKLFFFLPFYACGDKHML